MDGSAVVIPTATPPGGLAREDALFRIVYYGEALRAMTEHVSDSLISGPCVPMIEMLDEAFDRMSETRDSFGPEEFTLFVMSKMLGLCDDVDEARQFQVGAAQYILKSADALPEAYCAVVDDARQMLRRSELTRPDAQDEENAAPERPAAEPAEASAESAPPPSPAARKTFPARQSAAAAAPTATPPPVAPPEPKRQARSETRGGATVDSKYTRGPAARPRRMNLSPGKKEPRNRSRFEVFMAVATVAFCLSLFVLYSLGLVEGHDEMIVPVGSAALDTQ